MNRGGRRWRPLAGIVLDPKPIHPSKPTRVCPRCGAGDVIPVVYGYPSPDMWEAEQRGEIVLSGCIVSSGFPTWQCGKCSSDGAHQRQ